MDTETRQCKNCGSDFDIQPDDFDFYKKINVPPPVWCPDCRMQARLIWRNEHTLYKRKCDAPGHTEDIISMYAPEKNIKVYDHEFWFSDNWDTLEYGQDYDFSKPFFSQFQELLQNVPHVALFDSKSVDSNYCNITVEHKNCYLVTAGWNNEDSAYSNRISHCTNTFDSYICHKTDFGYENLYCKDSYRLFYSMDSQSCSDSYFLYDSKNCSNCIGCTNLRNKQYHIWNKPYSKEEYGKKKEELRLWTREGIAEARRKFSEQYAGAVHKYANLINTENVVGDHVENSKNCHYCFDLAGEAENSKFCHWGTYGLKDSYDTGPGTGGKSELTYEGISIGVNNAQCTFGAIIWYSNDVHYSFNCQDSEHLFGCVGLRNKKYCILNKQYTKEEYEALLPKVIEHMNTSPYVDSKNREFRYGQFFPPEISPFSYNETVAQDYMPLSSESAGEKGFAWRKSEEKDHAVTVSAEKNPGSIEDVPDSITQEVMECAHRGECNDDCSKAFRITPQELTFYKAMKLPLPDLCPKCRHYARLKKRNPLKLWKRSCECSGRASKNGAYTNTAKHFHGENPCPNKFETPYAPERKEAVYCEDCYNAEIV